MSTLAPVLRTIRLGLSVGPLTFGGFEKRLVVCSNSLEDILSGGFDLVPALSPEADGYAFESVPVAAMDQIRASMPDFEFGRSISYQHRYIDLSIGLEAYLGTLSSKTRSTLRRKARKLANENGGKMDVREYRTPDQMSEFMRIAGELSARTYQERRLGAGLPTGPADLAATQLLAESDSLRGYILFLGARAVSYLYLPRRGESAIYSHLGYDPEFASLSVGTVLQFEALGALFKWSDCRYLDFTSGDGAHKRLFSSSSVECVGVLALRRTLRNRAALRFVDAGDQCVALLSASVDRLRLGPVIRRMLRGG